MGLVKSEAKCKPMQEITAMNQMIHWGRIAALCYEEVIELPECDPGSKLRARSVYLGPSGSLGRRGSVVHSRPRPVREFWQSGSRFSEL